MKNCIKLIVGAALMLAIASCGRNMYTSSSSGQDNTSYVTVLTAGDKYLNVSVEVDGVPHPYGKVYTLKMKRKAARIAITPGQHKIRVVAGGEVLTDENVFIGLQETKQIVLP